MIEIVKYVTLLVTFSAVLGSQLTVAQTPDAGAVRREIENTAEPPEPKKPDPVIPDPVVEGSPESTEPQPFAASVAVRTFRFTGNTLVETDVLTEALKSYFSRPLRFDELEAATARVAEVYRQAGWIARPYLPPQDISDGQVTIAIVEATFGMTRINGESPKRISSERLTQMIKAEQPKGQFINANALDSALRRINELPGITVSGVLSAGDKAGETDLVLNITDTSVVSGNVVLDNAGSKYTGEHRVIATGFLNSPFGYGERFSTTLLYSEGTTFGQLTATVPVGVRGWQVGTHASVLNYSLGDDFGVLGAEGSSTEFGLDANYAWLRSRDKNLSLALAYNETQFENSTALGVESEYSVDAVEATLYGHLFDGAGGANQASVHLANGDVENKLTGIKGDRFNKVGYAINRQQRLSERFSLFGGITGQWADSNLTSSEKFTLGGPAGVRAYRASEGSGDTGHLLTAEVRARLPRNFTVAAFYDTGTINVQKDPRPGNIQIGNVPVNHYSLSGAGLSARWQVFSNLSVKATWAKPIGTNKGALNNSEQDEDRFWLQVGLVF